MIRFGHACVAALTGTAFAFGWWLVVPAVATVVGLTRFVGPRAGLFNQIYRLIIDRDGTRWEAPDASHQFAQLMSFMFLAAATVMFLIGWATVGWTLTLIVTALATLAAVTQICIGCLLHQRWSG